MLITRQRTKRPTNPLDLASLGHHQAVPLDANLVDVALTTRLGVDPGTARVGIEIRAAMSEFFVGMLRWIAIVADNATGRVAQRLALGHDLSEHLRADFTDWFDVAVTLHAS